VCLIREKEKRKKFNKFLKVVVLGCGVCPCGWDWVSILWCLPGWRSLCLCLTCRGLFALLGIDYFLFHVWEIFDYNFFKNFLSAFLFFFFIWDPYNSNDGAFNIVPKVTETFLNFFFIRFPLFSFSAVISTILSSSSFIHSSASIILLLFPSSVFSISVIVLFISICLFFISSTSLVIVLTVLNASCIFSILISSLQSIFIITILNSLSGELFIHLFALMSFYPALSLVLYFSIFFIFFS